jgi:hypothetical protein
LCRKVAGTERRRETDREFIGSTITVDIIDHKTALWQYLWFGHYIGV